MFDLLSQYKIKDFFREEEDIVSQDAFFIINARLKIVTVGGIHYYTSERLLLSVKHQHPQVHQGLDSVSE